MRTTKGKKARRITTNPNLHIQIQIYTATSSTQVQHADSEKFTQYTARGRIRLWKDCEIVHPSPQIWNVVALNHLEQDRNRNNHMLLPAQPHKTHQPHTQYINELTDLPQKNPLSCGMQPLQRHDPYHRCAKDQNRGSKSHSPKPPRPSH